MTSDSVYTRPACWNHGTGSSSVAAVSNAYMRWPSAVRPVADVPAVVMTETALILLTAVATMNTAVISFFALSMYSSNV